MQGGITVEGLCKRFRSILSLGRALDLAGSPIEQIFLEEAIMSRGGYVRLANTNTVDEFYDWLRRSSDDLMLISPQVSVGPYRCDFIAGRFSGGRVTLVVVECDGFEFHRKTRYQRDRDARRDLWMRQEHGIKSVLRFDGSRIHADASLCVNEMLIEVGVLRRVPRDWDDGVDDDATFRLVHDRDVEGDA